MVTPHQYAQAHAQDFIEQFIELLRIPSISTLQEHAVDVERAAQWIAYDMKHIGLHTVEIHQADGYLPLVYGEWLGAGEDAPTVLVYCHFDVQPAAMADGWLTPPFQPTQREGKIYARGALDSKNHVVAHLKAVESLLATGGAPVNIKLLFEGEEESGSAHIFQFVKDNPDKLKADVIVVSDGSMPDENQPVLVYGLRGIVQLEVTVTGPMRDLHSGHYGGNVHNPIQALTEILAALHDQEGRVTVPGFYDDVRELTPEERDVLSAIQPWVEREWQLVTGAPMPWGEPDFRLHERIGVRPTLEINGIAGGFFGKGFKTVLPHKAWAKLSCRLVPDQHPATIAKQVKETILRLAPPTVRVDVTHMSNDDAPGVLLDYHSRGMQTCIQAYEKGWGKKPVLTREGGSVPVVAVFQQVLDADLVMMPFGYKGGGAHSTNEYMVIEMFHKGIATAIHFYQLLGASK
ncbi:MAG: dipeptidase [Phototrophicales bacterium]|nr:MAG: dipeptidase [Phototrophicales bacterium]